MSPEDGGEDALARNSVTHCITTNGTSHLELLDDLAERVIRRQPTLLDGKERFATSLSRFAPGKRLGGPASEWDTGFFLQAAGTAGHMMIEVRMRDDDGSVGLHRLAAPGGGTPSARQRIDIHWDGRITRVPPDEVFSAIEAGDIFWYYYLHDRVPEQYELRLLESW